MSSFLLYTLYSEHVNVIDCMGYMHKSMCPQGPGGRLSRGILTTDDTHVLTPEPNPCVRHTSTPSTALSLQDKWAHTRHTSLPRLPSFHVQLPRTWPQPVLWAPLLGTCSLPITLTSSSSDLSVGNAFPPRGHKEGGFLNKLSRI